jgi:TonB family protein
MQFTHWKLALVVSASHIILFVAIAHLGLRPLDYGAQSLISTHFVELRSAASENRVTSRSIAMPSLPMSKDAVQHPSVSGDAPSIVAYGNASELVSAPITPPSADAYAPFNPKPPYPISSRENGEQGAVMLYACITDHGKVERVDLAQSSGYPALDRSALNTIRQWSFRPAQESGKSIPMCYRLPIRFLLSSSTLPVSYS